jgi:N-methylhydantoinase A
MLISDYIQEYAQTVRLPADVFTPEKAEETFRGLEARGREAMLAEGVAPMDIEITRFVDMCYMGQSFELMVPFGPSFIDAFHRRHEQRYGYEDSSRPTQVVNVRVRVVGPSGAVYDSERELERPGDGRAAQIDTRRMFVVDSWREAPVYARDRLQPGDRFQGPALVTEYSATTYVPHDFSARVDGFRNLLLRQD